MSAASCDTQPGGCILGVALLGPLLCNQISWEGVRALCCTPACLRIRRAPTYILEGCGTGSYHFSLFLVSTALPCMGLIPTTLFVTTAFILGRGDLGRQLLFRKETNICPPGAIHTHPNGKWWDVLQKLGAKQGTGGNQSLPPCSRSP